MNMDFEVETKECGINGPGFWSFFSWGSKNRRIGL